MIGTVVASPPAKKRLPQMALVRALFYCTEQAQVVARVIALRRQQLLTNKDSRRSDWCEMIFEIFEIYCSFEISSRRIRPYVHAVGAISHTGLRPQLRAGYSSGATARVARHRFVEKRICTLQ